MKTIIRSLVCLICFFSLNAVTHADGQSSLLAYFPFNGNAVDESGNGRDGTIDGPMLTHDRNGVADSAFFFRRLT